MPQDPPPTWTDIALGIRRLLPISAFVLPFGVAYGAAAVEHGLTPGQTVLMSALVFTATAQFAALSALTEPVAYLSLFMLVLTLSGRHVVMGAALGRRVSHLPRTQRLGLLFLLSDANFAAAQDPRGAHENALGLLIGGGLALWLAWVLSTGLGAFGGDALGDLSPFGFGAVMICFFAATAVSILRSKPSLAPAMAVGAATSAVLHPVLETGWNVIVAAVAGGVVAAVLRRDA
ncbi:MAG: AzlC family ABC transporter permease [Pseudomonadota bacterium]